MENPNINQNYIGQKWDWLRILLVIILLIGISLRFLNIGNFLYSNDEAVTALRVSGYTWTELIEQEFNGEIIRPENLQKYQRINSEKTAIDTIKGLALEEPQVTPLYFVITRFWAELFGDSVAAIRSCAVFLSLLALPCIYWLCRELFPHPLIPWVAMAIIAVSPFHVMYAQIARMYSMMTTTILFSCASLMYAIRVQTKLSWIIYTVSIALGLYNQILFILVVIGHGIYVLVIERFKLTHTLKKFLIASIIGIVTFIPWIMLIIPNLDTVSNVTATAQSKVALLSLIQTWVRNLVYIFFDLGIGEYLAPFVLILVAYAIYFLCKNSPRKIWLFILTLSGVTAAVLMLPGIILGSGGAGRIRYFIAFYLGIELAIAYLTATQISSHNFYANKIWSVIFAVLISGGIFSCIINSQPETRWDIGRQNSSNVNYLNQNPNVLLISDLNSLFNPINLMSMSHKLNSNLKLQLLQNTKMLKLPDDLSNVLLYNPSGRFRSELKQNYPKIEQIEKVNDRVQFYKLKTK